MWRKLIGLAVALVIIFILAIVFISLTLDRNDLANCTTPSDQSEQCRTADVIVAVSGGDTAARARRAAEMYKAGWAKRIIFSGAAADSRSISNAEAMKRIATDMGVPAKAITLDETSRDTKENAQNTVDLLHEIKANRVILVSSPYHLRRVKLNFELADNKINYRTAAADDQHWRLWFLTVNGWKIATTELAGLAELSAEAK